MQFSLTSFASAAMMILAAANYVAAAAVIPQLSCEPSDPICPPDMICVILSNGTGVRIPFVCRKHLASDALRCLTGLRPVPYAGNLLNTFGSGPPNFGSNHGISPVKATQSLGNLLNVLVSCKEGKDDVD